MFFPQAMVRLIWIVPKDGLASSLQKLAETETFHLSEQCRLGKDNGKAIESLQRLQLENKRCQDYLSAQQWFKPLPATRLLHYRIVEHTDLALMPEGTVLEAGDLCIWIGHTLPVELDTRQQLPRQERPLNLSDRQKQLLFDTAFQIGCVGNKAIIDGWIPSDQQERVSRLLDDEIFLMTPAHKSGIPLAKVPSHFKRPKALQGFANLMGLYETPAYPEIDPTPILAIGFTVLFGMMFADLGQGLLLFLAGALIYRQRVPFIGPEIGCTIAQVLMPVGLSAALFGILFGSVFAREDWIPALLFHPMDEVLILLSISVLIGICVLCGGMVIGLINAFLSGRLKQRFWDNFGPIGLLFYLSLISLFVGLMAEWRIVQALSMVIAIGGFVSMAIHYFRSQRGEPTALRLLSSLIESYDFTIKFMVQTLSFVRIAAFTFAHIALSMALMIVVELLSPLPWLAWFCFVLGNLLITLLEGVLVSIQVIRLHFFELFTKFVTGGGVAFRPLLEPSTATSQPPSSGDLR
jgi:V/A-type H+-transporting ATPase subunit I